MIVARTIAEAAPKMAAPDALASKLEGTPLLLLLDIDGTLCDIVSQPDGARVPDATRRTLARLAASPGVHVALVTGRAVRDARRVVGALAVPIVGNHGLEWVDASGDAHPIEGWDAVAPAMRRVRDELAVYLSQIDGALLEDKTYSLSVHYRNVAPHCIEALRDDVSDVAESAGLRVAHGKALVNILPPIDVDKGHAVLRIVRESGGLVPSASVVFAGDDVTDENAFRALAAQLPRAVTVRVGADDAPSAARYRVASPAALARVLEFIAERRGA